MEIPFTNLGKTLDGASGKEKSCDSQEFGLGPEKSQVPMRWSCPADHWKYTSEVQRERYISESAACECYIKP